MSSFVVAALVTYASVAVLVLIWDVFLTTCLRDIQEVVDSVSKSPQARILDEKQIRLLLAVVWLGTIVWQSALWPLYIREAVEQIVDEFRSWRDGRKKKVENDKK